MFTAILLACSLDGQCMGIAGPAWPTLDDCMRDIPNGWLMIEEGYPHLIVKNAKCIAWGENV